MKTPLLDLTLLVQKNLNYIIHKREYFHQHPELSGQEFNTSKMIYDELNRFGVSDIKMIAETGVTGLIEGEQPGPVILLRADIDALPINEIADVPYQSVNKGVMHACGHDGHTAVLLGVAKILSEHRHTLKGTIRLAFQPAEEGDGGAKRMIEEGILHSPKVDYALAFHVSGFLPEGKIGIKSGGIWYSCDDLTIQLKGKGGHSSQPHLAVNPIMLGLTVIDKMTHYLANNPQLDGNILTFCQFLSGNSCNIIPDTAELKGTLRTYQNNARETLLTELKQTLESVTYNQGSYELKAHFFAPVCFNNEMLTQKIVQLLQKYCASIPLVWLDNTIPGAEDFAFFSQVVPSFYFMAGIRQDKDRVLHTPDFQWDSKALQYPTLALLNMVYNLTEFTAQQE